MLTTAVTSLGFDCTAVGGSAAARAALAAHEFDLAIVDIDLGEAESSGLDLVATIDRKAPWTAVLIVSAHRSPRLATSTLGTSHQDHAYLVKSDIASVNVLSQAIDAAITGDRVPSSSPETFTRVTPGQADLLRLIAQGWSNQAIADRLDVERRSVEQAIRRTYRALRLEPSDDKNSRVEAVRMWQQGLVEVGRSHGAPSS